MCYILVFKFWVYVGYFFRFYEFWYWRECWNIIFYIVFWNFIRFYVVSFGYYVINGFCEVKVCKVVFVVVVVGKKWIYFRLI